MAICSRKTSLKERSLVTIDPAQYDQDPGCDDVAPCHRTNLTGRIGRGGARHRKTAIFGWLAFDVASFFIGSSVVGAKQATDASGVLPPATPATDPAS